METHRIDSIIKNAIKESGNFYDTESNNAKERIWNHIRLQKQNHSKPLLFRLLVAASILLIISLSITTISNIKNRKAINSLIGLNHKLKNEIAINKKDTLILKQPIVATNINTLDTIYIVKRIIEHEPIISIQQITDTIYIQQMVFVEKEQGAASLTLNENNSLIDSIFRTDENNYKSEILIRNIESLKMEKGKKIQIKFGCNKDQINSGTLAFTTNL